jgi:hypothetical protein
MLGNASEFDQLCPQLGIQIAKPNARASQCSAARRRSASEPSERARCVTASISAVNAQRWAALAARQ